MNQLLQPSNCHSAKYCCIHRRGPCVLLYNNLSDITSYDHLKIFFFWFLSLPRNSSTLFCRFQQMQTMRYYRQATKYVIYSIHIQSLMPAQHFHEEIVHQNRGHSGSLKRHDWWDEGTLHTDRHHSLFLKPSSSLASERSCPVLSTAISLWHLFSSI